MRPDHGHIHIKKHIPGQIWLSSVDECVCNIRGNLGIEVRLQGSCFIPHVCFKTRAGEGNGRNTSLASGVGGYRDGAGDVNGAPEVGAGVGTGDDEFRLGAVPEVRADEFEAVSDGGDGVSVYPVEARAG